ncbi:hypothetical protein [Lactiplantibacillus fabifermentans]|uniref:Integral membrane protein n=2 Tax=Lactiplantibacillus fabifermentans TaxID=483011 RepID=A0A0R2NES7_9LACO|nr:hypothetical protein [Lactiplantibacillus fabifermentans]ETY72657.1 membrane protein [Lactiplantibacillus fabifermentans T30PCM01]KRO23083.1 hypothetical protein DY78_GL001852 [Lactiplantibacillus fabifermentans DSM 21115]
MKDYYGVQIMTGIYVANYMAALYFASGVQQGFKLDDNQLTGYVLCGLLLVIWGLSLRATTLKMKKIYAGALTLGCGAILGVTILNIVSFNERFVYFMVFVDWLPFIILFHAGCFLFWHEKNQLK